MVKKPTLDREGIREVWIAYHYFDISSGAEKRKKQTNNETFRNPIQVGERIRKSKLLPREVLHRLEFSYKSFAQVKFSYKSFTQVKILVQKFSTGWNSWTQVLEIEFSFKYGKNCQIIKRQSTKNQANS